MVDHRKRFALLVAAIVVVASCRCRKDPPPRADLPPPIGSYSQVIGELREAGLSDESTCEQPPLGVGAQGAHREFMANMRKSDKTDAAAASVGALAKMSDDALVSEVRLRVYDKRNMRGTRALSAPERVVWLFDVLDGEVNNGGFHQYFSNSSGDCALKTLEALRALPPGSELLALYERALAVFPASRPAEDRKTRNEQMSRLPDEFESWHTHDDAYYAMKDRETVVARYLRAHLAELDLPAQ
jgi:hypothetical protein